MKAVYMSTKLIYQRTRGKKEDMAITPEQFCNEMKIIHPDIEVVGLYTKAVEPVLVR